MAHEGSKYGGYGGVKSHSTTTIDISEQRAARRRLNKKKKNKGLDLMWVR